MNEKYLEAKMMRKRVEINVLFVIQVTLEEGDESGENVEGTSETTLSGDERGGEAEDNPADAGM